jgi:serine/threonine-protein kinase
MSVVYKAEHPRLGNLVALKVLAPELATDDVFRARFLEESRIAASLNHPNVIPIFDMGPWDDLLYIAMRYVAGSDLRAVLKTCHVLGPDQAVLLIGQAGRALDAAHRQGLVHRDVKPGNILVERGADDGDPDHDYLADFGITKHTISRSGLTPTGELVGTIDYVAPEQIQGRPVDGRADIYSLGCVLYECLTGSVPFPKDLDAAVILAHIEERPPAPSAVRPELPAAIDDVMERVLAKEPEDRYPTCRELTAAAQNAMPGLTAHPRSVLSSWSNGAARTTRPHGGSSQPRGNGRTPGQDGPPANGGPASGSRPGGQPPGSRPRVNRASRWLVGAGVLALVIAAAIGGWAFSRNSRTTSAANAAAGSSSHAATHPSSPAASSPMPTALLHALVVTNESATAKGLLPPSNCHPQGTSAVTCRNPALGVSTATFRIYPSLTALYAAYVATVRHLSNGQFQVNYGDCTADRTSGEVSWNHNYQHPRNYSLSQSRSGTLLDDQAAGRVFCTFINSQLYLVWTQNDGHLLAMLNGAPHDNAWRWWRDVHHSITISGASMHM